MGRVTGRVEVRVGVEVRENSRWPLTAIFIDGLKSNLLVHKKTTRTFQTFRKK